MIVFLTVIFIQVNVNAVNVPVCAFGHACLYIDVYVCVRVRSWCSRGACGRLTASSSVRFVEYVVARWLPRLLVYMRRCLADSWLNCVLALASGVAPCASLCVSRCTCVI